ncbi:extracellular solute-binding protein [Patescibacteria group bacterium]|nr:MAG: extracellular solute-binding protein [Patescibacteria group bacterium]
MKLFNVIVVGVFIALAVVSVFIFATYTSFQKNAVGPVVIWGSFPHSMFESVMAELSANNNTYEQVTYRNISKDQFIPSLVQAIASGTGPDLVIFPAENLVHEGDKLQSISYQAMSRRDFQNTFVEAGEIFLESDGIKALPFSIDPLVMYWNRGLFSVGAIAEAPRYWDQIADITAKLTRAEKNGTLTQSAVAFGTWDNVDHAKEIFLTLSRQLGNPIMVVSSNGEYESILGGVQTGTVNPADSALRFYTDFSDPVKPVYSWNRSQPTARSSFIAGKLGIYFGRASELYGIRQANPNLNFDVAPMPSIRGGGSAVYAEVTGLAIPRGSKNPQGALAVAQAFTSKSIQPQITNSLFLPSVRRDSFVGNPNDPYVAMFQQSALLSFAFLDPDPMSSDSIFKRMVENVFSGKLQVSEATRNASAELQALIGVR